MPSPYVRTISGSFNDVYIDPSPTRGPPPQPTQIFPAGGLTKGGQWVPWQLNDDGTPVVPGAGGASYYDDVFETTTPGAPQTLVEQTVPPGTTRTLMQVIVITRVTGAFQVLADDALIGSGRTGPAGTGPMLWTPARSLAAGTIYKVLFQSRADSPAQDVEAYVQATDTTS